MASNVNTAAPKHARNRRLGKNKKKAWRAAKVQDVEEFLEDEERQKRTGGLVAEKSDKSLFVLDTAKGSTAQVKLSKKSRRNLPLKSEALLVPDPLSHKAVAKPQDSSLKKGQKRLQKEAAKELVKSKTKTKLAAKAQRKKIDQDREVRRAIKRKLPEVEEDLWADDDPHKIVTVKPPKRFRRKPSAHPATALPHPGASANPSFQDHQDLLLQAREVEVTKIKKEQKLYNALDAKFPTAETAPDKWTRIEEMAGGLISESESEDEETPDEPISINPPVRREDVKTKKQRRRQKELVEEEKERKAAKALKMRELDVFNVKKIKKQIREKEAQEKEKAEKKQQTREHDEKYKTKTLGKLKFEEPDMPLKLTDELVGSLRELKPEGTALESLYKNFQKRNFIPPTVRSKHTKRKGLYKPKLIEKKGHKQITL